MKISIISDLHLDISFPYHLPELFKNFEKSDVLILAGDICPIDQNILLRCRLLNFYESLMFYYKNVILVLGNHDYYNTSLKKGLKDYKQYAKMFNLHVLENESVNINGIDFYGSTMWTSLKNNSYLNKDRRLNDFVYIDKMKPLTFRRKHEKFLKWFEQLEPKENSVMITHHLPHFNCIPDRFKEDPFSDNFCAFLSEEMINKFPIWICGHSHHETDFFLGRTRIINNPYGYPSEKIAFKIKQIEI